MSLTTILVTCIIGLVVGAIAKLLMPGKDPGGCIITMLLGIAGAWLGTFIGQMTFGGANYVAGWIMSIVAAMILLLLYRIIFGKRGV
ncbi:MAG: GlsB/YeaQ/YmgE family stress response membrane protein [Verrucomicrobiota bacterium]|nr:GlsB/YeaQ/YmgE family stress response membrane protein [Verrucomicrobiota bacterium]